jgi:glycosyltransferase involved in cell wall biosynthesis
MPDLVVIPVFNEAATLPAVVAEVIAAHPALRVLVVDDASTDGTGDLLPRLGVPWLELGQRLGVGGALRAGLRWARMRGHDRVIRLDGDGQHAADSVPALLEPLARGTADAVVGSRRLGTRGYRQPLLRRLVQRVLAAGCSRVTGQPVTDPTSGLWAFGPRAVRLLGDHYPRGYSEPELRLFLWASGLRVTEVPAAMRSRQGGRSSLTAARAVLAVARAALAMVVVPLRPPAPDPEA